MREFDNRASRTREEEKETPVCIRCCLPVDPLAHYCPNCGEATGDYTQYIPFVNIQWEAAIWGRAWRQMWSKEVSLPGRLIRLLMILWQVPILLIGLLFKSTRRS